MEGRIQTWTGYFRGWQNRWCLLESGVITVAPSADDYSSRICLNIRNATFPENATDKTQFEVHVPDHDIVYFKTTSEPMRQCWLDCLNAHRDKAHELNVHYPGHLALLTPEYAHTHCLAHHDELMKQVVAVKGAFEKLSGTPPGCLTAEQATDIYRLSAEATQTCANYINILRYLRSDAAALATPFRPPPRRAVPSSQPPPPPPPALALPDDSVSASEPAATASSGVVPAWERAGHLTVATATTAAGPDDQDSSECGSVIHHDLSSTPTSPPPELHLPHAAEPQPPPHPHPVTAPAPATTTIDSTGTHTSQGPTVAASAAPAHAQTAVDPAATSTNALASAAVPAAAVAPESQPAAVEAATRALPADPQPEAHHAPAVPAAAPVASAPAPTAAASASAPVHVEVGSQHPVTSAVAAGDAAIAGATVATAAAAAAAGSTATAPESASTNAAAATAPLARAPDDETFFSLLPHRFGEESMFEGEAIKTETFLNACRGILPVLDVLGPTTFAPVKSDISGNIAKIAARLQADPLQNVTLQNMVRLEMMKRTTKASGSATDALLWLKRALEFICVFLKQVAEVTDESLSEPAGVAYAATLSRYHGWMVRGIFSLAMKSVPYRRDFLAALGPAVPDAVLADMTQFADGLDRVLSALKSFYLDNKLDDPSVV